MKKFLSSLLALTMILSLVIVPAQATDNDLTVSGTKTVEVGDTTTLSVSVPKTVKVGDKTYNVKTTSPATTASWTIDTNSPDKVEFVGGYTGTNSVTVKGKTAGDATINVSMTVTYITSEDGAAQETTATATVNGSATVSVKSANEAFRKAITSIDLNGHHFSVSDVSNNELTFKLIGSESVGTATSNLGTSDTTYGTISYTLNTEKTQLTISGTKKSTNQPVSAAFTVSTSTVATPTVTVKANGTAYSSSSSPLTIYAGQKISLAASGYTGNNDAVYTWSASSGSSPAVGRGDTTTATWTAPSPASASGDTYTLTCLSLIHI